MFVIYLTDLSGWIIRKFFYTVAESVRLYVWTTWNSMKRSEQSLMDAACSYKKNPGIRSLKTATVRPPVSHPTNHQMKKMKTCWSLQDVLPWTLNTWTCQCWLARKNLQIHDAVLITCQVQWMIGRDGERDAQGNLSIQLDSMMMMMMMNQL